MKSTAWNNELKRRHPVSAGDPSQEYFADGMTDALIGDLAKIRGLQVISRTSAMHYKGTKKPLKEIASELKVQNCS